MHQNITDKTIVISAVNIIEGGTLSVLNDCVKSAINILGSDWKIIVLVNKPDTIKFDNKIIKFSYPLSKKSWLIRLFYEWVYFYFLSKKLKPLIWLSLHDITPNVVSKIRAVYCHNPSPFYNLPFKKILIEPKFWLFTKLYKYLYKINISKNNFIIVQQNWIRDGFKAFYGEKLNIIVAHPQLENYLPTSLSNYSSDNLFIYPALSRSFKNFEVICEAVNILNLKQINNFKVLLTIDGSENRYSKTIIKKYGYLSNISFVGKQKREDIEKIYNISKALIFPSKLETWGLPITEFKYFNKPILLANLPYAKETIGNYDKVNFFNPDDAKSLAKLMQDIINDTIIYSGNVAENINPPFAKNWSNLWEYLIFNKG